MEAQNKVLLILKKLFQILKYTFLFLFVLLFLLIVAVNLPVIHRVLTAKVNTIFHDKGIPVHVGGFYLRLDGKIGLQQIEFIVAPGDTMAILGKIDVAINPFPLLKHKIVVQELSLEDIFVNLQVDKETGELKLLSFFSKSEGRKPESEKPANSSWDIQIHKVRLRNIHFRFDDQRQGILIDQSVAKAGLDFEVFSLAQKLIRIREAKFEKVKGLVRISEGMTETDTVNSYSPETPWRISLQNFQFADIHFTLDQPDNGQRIITSIDKANITGSDVDLGSGRIRISKIELNDPAMHFITTGMSNEVKTSAVPTEGNIFKSLPWLIACDAIVIKKGLFLVVDTISGSYNGYKDWMPVKDINTDFTSCRIDSTGAAFNLDELSLALNNKAYVKSGRINFEMDSHQHVNLSLALLASLDKQQTWFKRNEDISLSAGLSGSTEKLLIGKLDLHSPSGIDLALSGYITSVLNMPQSGCDLSFLSNSISHNQADELAALFATGLKLPDFKPAVLSGSIKNKFLEPQFALAVRSESGDIAMNGNLNTKNTSGNLHATLSQLMLGEIIGDSYPDRINAEITAGGGLSPGNVIKGSGNIKINSVVYQNTTYHNINTDFTLADNTCRFELQVNDTAVSCNMNGMYAWNGPRQMGDVKGVFDIDAYALHLVPEQLSGKGEITGNFSMAADSLTALVNLKNFTFSNGLKTSILNNTDLSIRMADNLLDTKLESDFMTAAFHSRSSLSDLLKAIDSARFENVFSLDSANFLNLDAISQFPGFRFNAGLQYNPVFAQFVPDTVFSFDNIHFLVDKENADSLPQAEISAGRLIYNQYKCFGNSMKVKFEKDKLSSTLVIDSLDAGKIPAGSCSLELNVLPGSMQGSLQVSDHKGLALYHLEADVRKKDGLIIINSPEPAWIINSNTWTVSPSEFLRFESATHDLVADLHLQCDTMRIGLTGRKSVKLSLGLEDVLISKLIMPEFAQDIPDGFLNGNVAYSDNGQQNLDFKLDINQFKWDDFRLDRIATEGNLVADTSGIVESKINVQLTDSAAIVVTTGNKNNPPGQFLASTFTNFPVPILSPFIGDYANKLQGTVSGEISLGTENTRSSLNGQIRMKDVSLNVIPLNSWFSVPCDTLEISHNRVDFKKFIILDTLQKQLDIEGTIDLAGLDDIDKMTTNLKVTADRLQVLNTSVKDNPELFGSIVVNSGLTITGALKSPVIKGSITLEKGTNITYRQVEDISVSSSQKDILFAQLDSNRMVFNSDTIKISKFSGMPFIQAAIHINPETVFNVEIASNYNIKVRFSGDGLLDYAMLPNNTMSLTGNYEIRNGSSELKFPGCPMKYFIISPGSSFRWNGDVEDPELNLEATNKVKGSYVNPVDNQNRNCDFIVSMKLANRLSDLSIVFDVKSPDQYISSVLNSLTPDERMKQAVNLLLFEGIDLPGIKSSTSYLSAQIDNFWQTQLNSATKSTFKKTDLSFGVDTYTQTSASGAQEEKTSLSYEVERKFFKDKASVKVSGRLSDNVQEAGQTNSMVENFIFEYSLDTVGSKFLKVYMKKDYEDILEGEITKSGAGFIYRKSYPRLKDIWQRKRKQ